MRGALLVMLICGLAQAATPTVELELHRSTLRRFPGMERVALKTPGVADVRTLGDDTLELSAARAGATVLQVWTDAGVLSVPVRVTAPHVVTPVCLAPTATCALAFIRANDFDGAQHVVERCLRATVDDASCHRLQAVLCEYLDDTPRQCAIRTYGMFTRTAAIDDPNVSRVKALLEASLCFRPSAGCARSLFNAAKPDAARYLLETCLELNPADADCHASLAEHCSVWTGNERCAEAEASTALQFLPSNHAQRPKLLLMQARAQLKDHRYEAARATLTDCLTTDAANVECTKLMGSTCARLEDTECAETNYRRFLELAPQHPDAVKVRALFKR